MSQPAESRKRLFARARRSKKLRQIPDIGIWNDIADIPTPEGKAAAYHAWWMTMTPDEQEAHDKMIHNPVLELRSDRFRIALNKLKKASLE